MNSPFFARGRIVVGGLLIGLTCSAVAVEVDTNQLARCAGIAAVDTRVACYDALAKSVLPHAREPVSPAATATTPAAPVASFNPNDPASFGLTQRQLKASPEGPQSIRAIVSQITEDRLHNVSLVLDNGQTWVFIEPEPRVRPGDSVTIKRASLGSFLMTTPSRRSYRVERAN